MDIIYRYNPYQPLPPRDCHDAAEALELLRSGNARFAEVIERMQQVTLGAPDGEPIVIPVSPQSLGLPVLAGLAPRQSPFALVLGCSDARAPVESLFDRAFNDLFVIRIAGNVLGVECLGSIDYALRQFGGSLKAVVVLGHSSCGAVTAAVDTYLDPKDYADIAATFALRSLVDRIQLAVRGGAKSLERVGGVGLNRHPGYRTALIETAVYLNAAVAAYDLRREVEALKMKDVRVVFTVYDLSSLRVHSLPGDPSAFHDAPTSADEFNALGLEIAQRALKRESIG
jgi:carbonic anhydrase